MEQFTNKVIQGDCIKEIKKLPDNSVDAIITDPPYGLEFMNKNWDKFKDKNDSSWNAGTMGDLSKLKNGENYYYKEKGFKTLPIFRGSTNQDMLNFQNFSYNWAKECLRVLKPGGYLLSFGGTRTYHRMVCGVEDAGFEIRDCILWLYGSGFPKSLNIGKAVDKLQGNEREVVFKNPYADGHIRKATGNISDANDNVKFLSEYKLENGLRKETKGTSEWEGWGTALKPAVEPIVVARKPLSEKNVALNVLKWGTGGINIDESRIEVDMDKEGSNAQRIDKTYRGTSAIWNNADSPTTFDGYSKGRFPANFILECTCDKLKDGGEIKTPERNITGNTSDDVVKFAHDSYHTGFTDKVKIHTDPNCPCYMLDEQSGELKSGAINDVGKGFGNSEIFGQGKPIQRIAKASKGGASRFFYCAKSSKSERNKGTDSFINIEVFNMKCENKQEERSLIQGERLVKLSVDMETLQIKDIEESGIKKKEDLGWNTIWFGKNIMEKYSQDFQSIIKMKTNSTMLLKTWNWLMHLLTKEYILDVNLSMENGGNLAENVDKSKELIITMNEKMALALGVKNVVSGMQLKIKLSEGKCDHPTVKPIKLMEYLIKLVSKENAVILDPFLGSGTTAIACLKTNRKFIGIEKESDYVKIAEARIKPYLSQQKLI